MAGPTNIAGFGCCGGGGGSGVVGTIPYCFCTDTPTVLAMVSADETCNYNMFQSCTITWQPSPAAFSPAIATGTMIYSSYPEGFVDPISDSTFYYFLTCIYSQFTLTRIYPTSPYGSPYEDGILYTWNDVGPTGSNTCAYESLHLDDGTPFAGSTCTPPDCVTIDGGT